MKRIILKKKTILLSLMLLLAVSLLCFGCTPDTEQPKDEPENKQSEVYIVSDSSRTTHEWDMKYGAIKADGTMVLPMEYSQVRLIEDKATGEPLWLQTYELQLKDGVDATELTDEMLRDYYESPYMGEESKYFNHQYKLYDLDGSLIQELGSVGVKDACGEFTLEQNGYLVHRPKGGVFYTNANAINWAEDCYIVTYDQYRRVCVMDSELNVLLDIEGKDGFTDANGVYYLVTKENGKNGLCKLDGTQIVPNEYDYITSYYSGNSLHVQASQGGKTAVISLLDGTVVYQTFSDHDYVQEMFDDFMVIQKRYESETAYGYPVYHYKSQLYNYNGEPVSDLYMSLTPQNDFYERTKEKNGEGVLIFTVTAQNGRKYLMNEKEEEVFALMNEQWATVLTEDSIIVDGSGSNEDTRQAIMCRFDGTILNEKNYESINRLYLQADDGYYSRSELAVGNYQYNNMWLQDVLDADGNILLERLKSVTMLSEDLFWVEKGFSQGLMDRSGNWLYEQSLFDGAADE